MRVGDRRQPTPNPSGGGEDSYTGEMGIIEEVGGIIVRVIFLP
ncbi:hypothetical protein [Okeania sp. SIO2B3]|nr:hypothetical protein [Okeania sp. SIO2B3]